MRSRMVRRRIGLATEMMAPTEQEDHHHHNRSNNVTITQTKLNVCNQDIQVRPRNECVKCGTSAASQEENRILLSPNHNYNGLTRASNDKFRSNIMSHSIDDDTFVDDIPRCQDEENYLKSNDDHNFTSTHERNDHIATSLASSNLNENRHSLINPSNNLQNFTTNNSSSTTTPTSPKNKRERTRQYSQFASRFSSVKTIGKFMKVDVMSLIYLCLTTIVWLSFNSPSNSRLAIKFVEADQRFEAQPEREYLIPSGHHARLRCLVRERQGECLWLRNGRAVGNIARKYKFERMPEDGDCSLQIQNVSVQLDDGLWQCQVTPSELEQDTLQSREVALIVLVAPEAPQIKNTTSSSPSTSASTSSSNSQQQFNGIRTSHHHANPKLVLEESKVKHVLCEMRGGNPEPRIEWILDGRNVSKEAQSSSFFSQAATPATGSRVTQSRLRLADVRRSMNGKNLTCIGIHQTGNQSSSVELDVQYLPTVSVIQREYSIVEGSPLSISCQVDANPPPNLINWRLVNDNAAASASSGLLTSGRTHNTYHSLSAGHSPRSEALSSTAASAGSSISLPTRPGPILEFERISRDLNQNVFECLAQNSYGISLPADVKLNVLYAPYLVNTSNSESVPVGSDAQLACIFDGNPEPEIKWFYTDPLSRLASASQLTEPNSLQLSQQHGKSSALSKPKSQQFLNIKNVTYRNEGDYHCEARNQINGVYYGVRSSNIILDVFGEPQFLIKSPVIERAVRGSKSDVSATFCSDPAPNKVFWQFGSIRLEVRLNGSQSDAANQQQPQSRPSIASLLLSQLGGGGTPASAPPGGQQQQLQQQQRSSSAAAAASSAIHQRFLVHPLQPLQRRDSAFSKSQTCFEARLSLLEPELSDERDYLLTVQNERGHQSATIRLQVSSPLSPVLIISSGLVTICAFFLLSIVMLFFLRIRQGGASTFLTSTTTSETNIAPGNGNANGIAANGAQETESKENSSALRGSKKGKRMAPADINSVEHLANGLNGHHYQQQHQMNGNVNGISNDANGGDLTGHTNGVVNGLGSGHANQASNLNSLHHHSNISVMSSNSDRLSISDNTIVCQQQSDQRADESRHQQSSSSEISSNVSASDQRQLLAGAANSTSPAISSLGSQQVDSHANGVDFNLASSTNSMNSSIASSTILRTNYNNNKKSNNTTHDQEDAMSLSISGKEQATANNEYEQENRPYLTTNDENGNQQQQHQNNATYRAVESVLRGVSNLSKGPNSGSLMMSHSDSHNNYNDKIIYANIDCSHEAALSNLIGPNQTSSSSFANYDRDTNSGSPFNNQQQARLNAVGPRSKVGATIAMMNSLAAQSNGGNTNAGTASSATTMGALNGAMRQHQFTSQQKQQQTHNIFPITNRKQAPPKPPKPIIQQASRFYQQAAAAAANNNSNNNNNNNNNTNGTRHGPSRLGTPTRDELAAEYSRLAFPERAEL